MGMNQGGLHFLTFDLMALTGSHTTFFFFLPSLNYIWSCIVNLRGCHFTGMVWLERTPIGSLKGWLFCVIWLCILTADIGPYLGNPSVPQPQVFFLLKGSFNYKKRPPSRLQEHVDCMPRPNLTVEGSGGLWRCLEARKLPRSCFDKPR